MALPAATIDVEARYGLVPRAARLETDRTRAARQVVGAAVAPLAPAGPAGGQSLLALRAGGSPRRRSAAPRRRR